MGKALPSYEEIPIACRMDEAVQSEYKRIENALVRVLRSDRRAAQKILSAYLNLLTVYPDQPYDQKPILYPDSDIPIVEPENIGGADTLGEKELQTLEIVKLPFRTASVRSSTQAGCARIPSRSSKSS